MPDDDIRLSQELCSFIAKSPTAFHAANEMARMLDEAGLMRLREGERWELVQGKGYYTMRNDSSIVAWKVPEHFKADSYAFQFAAAHTDSPMFKVKHVPELAGPCETLRLDVEGYGGMLDASWLDRPLGIAGRVVVRTSDGKIESRLVASEREVALIPNVAIHQRRDANKGFPYDHQVDLLPLFSAGKLAKGSFDAMVAELVGVDVSQLLGKDLLVVNRTEPRVWGWANEFVSAPRLDDLQCAFAGVNAFMTSENPSSVTVFACFDNEEVGSGTRQGAWSTMLRDALVRINAALGGTDEQYLRALTRSFMVSCDNGHAVHPNHPELFDASNGAHVNGGVIVKEVASQKYATDAFTRALFTAICNDAGVPVQTFANHSASAGGSTLGNLSGRQVSVATVDVGLAQLAMHSSYETAGVLDTGYLMHALQAFYACELRIDEGSATL